MKFLHAVAEGQGVSLYQALRDNLDDPIMRGTKARAFVELVERYAGSAAVRPASELLGDLLDKSGYEEALRTEGSQERLDNLAELRQAVYEYETSCGEEATAENFLAHASFMTNLDTGLDADKVKLMTIHAAKGLEFPHVFLCALNEGVLPSRKTKTLEGMEEERRLAFVAFTRAGMEEERRLAFVAFTRAADGLYLTCADGTSHEGIPRYPSRFILDVDRSLIDFDNPLPDSLVRDLRAYVQLADSRLDAAEAETLPLGVRVSHFVFGAGTVVGIDTDRGAYLVQFDSIDTPRSISFRAKLERME